MKREMDLVRDLLLSVEKNPEMDGTREFYISKAEDMGISGHSDEEVLYHLTLLIEAKFIDGAATATNPAVRRLTWKGHEFLADIKSEDVWSETKKRLSGLPDVALSVFASVAKSVIMHRVGLT